MVPNTTHVRMQFGNNQLGFNQKLPMRFCVSCNKSGAVIAVLPFYWSTLDFFELDKINRLTLLTLLIKNIAIDI